MSENNIVELKIGSKILKIEAIYNPDANTAEWERDTRWEFLIVDEMGNIYPQKEFSHVDMESAADAIENGVHYALHFIDDTLSYRTHPEQRIPDLTNTSQMHYQRFLNESKSKSGYLANMQEFLKAQKFKVTCTKTSAHSQEQFVITGLKDAVQQLSGVFNYRYAPIELSGRLDYWGGKIFYPAGGIFAYVEVLSNEDNQQFLTLLAGEHLWTEWYWEFKFLTGNPVLQTIIE